jgi:hypothetical protein
VVCSAHNRFSFASGTLKSEGNIEHSANGVTVFTDGGTKCKNLCEVCNKNPHNLDAFLGF